MMIWKSNVIIAKRFFWPFKNAKPNIISKPKTIYDSSVFNTNSISDNSEDAEKNKIWNVISSFNKNLIDHERNIYESKQMTKFNDQNKINFVPFNVQRNILKFPIYDNLLADAVESHWLNFSNSYDMKYIESIIMGYKEEGKLREFWIASIKLSMNLNFYRDLKFFLENEVKNETFRKELFSDDFYDCLIGYYFLHGNNLLAKTFHDIIYPKLQPLDIITIVKCCCLVKTKHLEHFQHILSTLFIILKDLNKDKLNSGIYDSLITFLYSRVLTISNSQLISAPNVFTHNKYDNGNNSLEPESQIQKGDDSKVFLYSIIDIHLHLLKNGEIPSNKILLNNLIRFLLNSVDHHNNNGVEKLSTNKSGKYKRIFGKLRKTFKYLLLSETNEKIYLPEYENWFNKEFIDLLLQFCFKDVSSTTNVKRNLNTYIFENRIPTKIYRDNQFNFWTKLYELSYQYPGRLSMNSVDSLFRKYVVQEEDTKLVDFILTNTEYSKILEIKMKSMNELNQVFENDKFLAILNDSFVSKTKYLDDACIITPIVLGFLTKYYIQLGNFDKIEYLVKQVDSIYDFRKNNKINRNKVNEYMKRLTEFYIQEAVKAQDHEDEPYGARGLALVKAYIQLLKNTNNFNNFLYTQNYLMSYFIRLKDFHNIEKLVSSLIELNRLNSNTINIISRFLINEIKLDNRNKTNYMVIMEILENYVSETKNLNYLTDYNWFNIYSMIIFVSPDYKKIEDRIFWVLNKILYSRFYTSQFPKLVHEDRIINEFSKNDQLILEDENEEIFNLISRKNENQQTLFLKLLDSTIKKLKTKEEALIYNDLSENSTFMIISEIQIDRYFNFIHKLFTPTLIKRIISTSSEKQPMNPTLGFDLIRKLHNMNIINTETLDFSKDQIKSAILSVIRKLYISNSNKISERWKLARSKSQFYKEFIAKEKFKAMSENSVIPKMLDVPKFEDVVDEFERIGIEIYGENW